MDWKPISQDGLQELIRGGIQTMSAKDRALWERVKMEPAKWALPPLGDLGGGFWTVSVLGEYALWYNDIEDGFNVSRFRKNGTLDEYICNQDDVSTALHNLVLANQAAEHARD